MKNLIKIILVAFVITFFNSCTKTGQIIVKNETELMMENVRWGDIVICERLLTGDASSPKTIKIKKESHEIYFESENNEYYIFAKTKHSYEINRTTVITIDKRTPLTINTKQR